MKFPALRSYIAAAFTILSAAKGAALPAEPLKPQQSKANSSAQLEQITVTATRTGATALQSTPIAITALSGRQLATRGVNNLNDLTSLSPNIELTDLAGQSSLFIRGIGTSNGGYVGSDPSSTLQIDGVYISRALAYDTDFLDVDRVEILRGPQGTLYGRNSVGGTINIITRTPSDTPQGEVRLSGGTYGEFGAQGYVSGPIGENGLLGSIAYGHQQHDPYLKNVSTGNAVQDDDTNATRGQLVIPFAVDGSLMLRADFSHREWAIPAFPKLLESDDVPLDDSILGDFTRVALNRNSQARETDAGTSAQIDYPLNSVFSIKSLTAFRADRSYVDDDPDASSLDVLRTVSSPSAEEQFSEEMNLTAKTEKLTIVGGLYYYLENFTDPLWVPIESAGISSFRHASLTDQAVAAYAQAEYKITPTISLVTGLRFTDETKHLRASLFYTGATGPDQQTALGGPLLGPPYFPPPFSVNAHRTDTALTPKFGLNYHPLQSVLLYVSATRGFKSGGYAIGAPDAADLSAGYGPEFIWSYEGGLKADWAGHRLRTNLTAFHYDFNDLQVTTEKPPIGEVTNNAGTAVVNGVEFETQARIAPQLLVYANLAYLDGHYTSYPAAYVSAFGTFNATGKRLSDAPRFAESAGLTYDFELAEGGTLQLGGDYHWQSRVFFTPANEGIGPLSNYRETQGDYGLLGAHATWTSPGSVYTVSVIGRNLTDVRYVTSTASFGIGIAGLPGDPRTVMVQASRRF